MAAEVIVRGKPAEVIKVDGQCYYFVRFTSRPIDSVADGLYEVCEYCCPGEECFLGQCVGLPDVLQVDLFCSGSGSLLLPVQRTETCRWEFEDASYQLHIACDSGVWYADFVTAPAVVTCTTPVPVRFYKLGCSVAAVGLYMSPEKPGWTILVQE
jgi:hypothetical protein